MNSIKTTKMSNFRWVICALLFLATTVNYMDRQVLSLTWKDFISPEFHWTDDDYEQIWEKVERKQVQDFDGFYTDYTLWYNVLTDEWCTVFGDNDIYKPWNSDHDMDFENNEQEARDWFESYSTEDEDY